jgi:hypothetical protein
MKLFRQNLDTINRLLRGIMASDTDRAVGAYGLGLIAATAELNGVTAPDSILEAAAECRTMEQLQDLYAACEELLA